ncbi:MAG: hypothetical protein H7Y15_12695 [Pseudonocardia sp.]|nr:hypothetical protein [Pseudonocardia sp.]
MGRHDPSRTRSPTWWRCGRSPPAFIWWGALALSTTSASLRHGPGWLWRVGRHPLWIFVVLVMLAVSALLGLALDMYLTR